MVIFDKQNNNDGKAQGTFHIQTMDLVLLFEHYKEGFLASHMDKDFLNYFKNAVNIVNSEYMIDRKDFLLRHSNQVGVQFSEPDNAFRAMMDELLLKKVLYDRKRLSSIPEERVNEDIDRLLSIGNSQIIIDDKQIVKGNPYYNYELNSLRCARYIIDLIEKYNRIVNKLYDGDLTMASFQGTERTRLQEMKEMRLQEMKRIHEILLGMGLGIKDSEPVNEESAFRVKKMPDEVQF